LDGYPNDLVIAGYDPVATNDGKYFFDAEAAERPIRFIETYLGHVKGRRGKLLLVEWQKRLVRNIFGWLDLDTKLRRYRSCYLEIPRKNGKTTLAAALAIWFTACDGERGADNLIAAENAKQAGLLYEIAKGMVLDCPFLKPKFKPNGTSKKLVYLPSRSYVQAIPNNPEGSHGENTHFCCVDEYHVQQSREFTDVLRTGTASRDQPFFLAITTAGHSRSSICWEDHELSIEIRDGRKKDPRHLPVIFAADEGDDWHSPATWAKANPTLGHAIKLDYLESEHQKAINQPSYENTFKRLHLNIWTEQETRFIRMDDWDKCHWEIEDRDLEKLPAYAALDLSNKLDLTAFSIVWPLEGDKAVVKTWFWLPKESTTADHPKLNNNFETWAQDDNANFTFIPGKSILAKVGFVQDTIMNLADKYNFEAIAYDRWQADTIVKYLQDEGQNMVMWGQGYRGMSQATKELERLVVEHKLNHLNNPVLNWNAQNATVETDSKGNICPVKPVHGSIQKVDGIISTIMALGLMRTQHDPRNGSLFDGWNTK